MFKGGLCGGGGERGGLPPFLPDKTPEASPFLSVKTVREEIQQTLEKNPRKCCDSFSSLDRL